MELIITHAYSQGQEHISAVDYFEVCDGDAGDELYCEFEDGHAETFKEVVIGGGDAE